MPNKYTLYVDDIYVEGKHDKERVLRICSQRKVPSTPAHNLFESRAEYLTDASREANAMAAVAIHATEVKEALASDSKVLRDLVLLNIRNTSKEMRVTETKAYGDFCEYARKAEKQRKKAEKQRKKEEEANQQQQE